MGDMHWKDKLAQWIAWWLPRRIVYFAYVRVHAHATQIYSSKTPDEITVFEGMEAWGQIAEGVV